MTTAHGPGWHGVDWQDLALVRSRLDAGADPEQGVFSFERPLHMAAEDGSPEVVAELARRVGDVDAEHEGRTALWTAVFHDRPDNARALVAAGADPLRPMMNGWSPARLALITRTPDLFGPTGLSLTPAETAAIAEARWLLDTLEPQLDDGASIACVGGITAAEAVRRLGLEPADIDLEEVWEDPWAEEYEYLVRLSDVPGGCVVVQPWGYHASDPDVIERLSAGTVCYAMFANPKSGDQGAVARDGSVVAWDTHPGGGHVEPESSAEEILATYLYQGAPVPYCYAGAGLRPADADSLTAETAEWYAFPED
ncbi:ankyrin repeat domain-containing protein [Nonomuraea sp. NPDC052634]|uniref:ankyrin repeat domain-containing protein n=1 Tax=Nonomuraea sp. NPDC052634 TaxID=3155813 RepID=UPI00344ACE22